MRKLHSQIWPPSAFPLGFPDPVFLANGLDAVPGLTNSMLDHPIRSSPPFIPSNEACFPSSVSLVLSNSTSVMVLLASRAAARACQCWRLRPQKPTQAEGYPQAIKHDQSWGCWRPPTFMPTYWGVPNSLRLQIVEPLTVIRSIASRCSRWSSKILLLRPPGLDSLINNRVLVEAKFCEGFVDAQGIGQDLEEMASRASSEWLVARHNPKIPLKALDALDGPPSSASLHPPGLDSLIANPVLVEPKLCEGFVHAQRIGQVLEEMASRASPKSIITCCKLSKSLLNPEKVQGSTMQTPSNPVTSHHFHWCSTDLSPDPSTLIHNFPETLRIAPPTRPSFHCRQSGCLWGEGVSRFCWCARHRPRPGRDGKQSVKRMTRGKNITQRLLFQKAFHLHWKLKDRSQETIFS